jgi:hypothetical protein
MAPAMSVSRPGRPAGRLSPEPSMLDLLFSSDSPCVISEGKMPGQMVFTRIWHSFQPIGSRNGERMTYLRLRKRGTHDLTKVECSSLGCSVCELARRRAPHHTGDGCNVDNGSRVAVGVRCPFGQKRQEGGGDEVARSDVCLESLCSGIRAQPITCRVLERRTGP